MRIAVFRAGLAAALLIAAAPAAAQTEAEMVGTYRVTVAPSPGSVCPPGQADFEVLRFGGDLVEISLDHTRTVADWDPVRKTFHGTIPFPDGDHLVTLDGSFARAPDQVTLAVRVRFPPDRPCEALLTGSIPASASAPPPPAPSLGATSTPASPPAATPPVFGVSANGQPVDLSAYARPATPAGPFGLKDAKLLGWVFGVMLVAGLLVRILRRKSAAPPPGTETPASAPPPEPPAPPKPARKPRARPKTARTEEEDELGEG